jgi:1-acyl-sn-glycerol-3-phosphate acyltransferase
MAEAWSFPCAVCSTERTHEAHVRGGSLGAQVSVVSRAKYWVGRAWLKAFGWELETETPPTAKFVLVAAPHTSGWDLPFMLATSYVMEVPISWMGKKELFAAPFGWFMRFLGGIPIDRSRHHNTVSWAVEQFEKADRLVLAVPAKGTRALTQHWKSGFYHIASGAQVPIGLARLDFGRRRCGVGAFITLTGDVRADMDKVRAFYATVTAKFPHLEGVPRLREEDDLPARSEVVPVMGTKSPVHDGGSAGSASSAGSAPKPSVGRPDLAAAQ